MDYLTSGCGPQSAWWLRVGLTVTCWTLLPSALAVPIPSCVPPELVLVLREKTSFVPSGDQAASNAVNAVVARPVCRGIFTSLVPSGWTVWSEPKFSNTIFEPSGDQLPSSSTKRHGVILCGSLPPMLTT